MQNIFLFTVLLFVTPEAFANDTNILRKNQPILAAAPSSDSRTNNVKFQLDQVAVCPNQKGRIEEIGSEGIVAEYLKWKEEVCSPQGFHMGYSIQILEKESDGSGCQVQVSFSCEDPKDPQHEDFI